MKPRILSFFRHLVTTPLATVITLTTSFAAAASGPALDPSVVADFTLPEGETTYIVSSDLTYGQETHFDGWVLAYDEVKLTFQGQTGEEKLSFDHAANTQEYFKIAPGGPDTELKFENLGEVNFINHGTNITNITVYAGAASGWADSFSYLVFRNIKGNVNFMNNGQLTGVVHHLMNIGSYGNKGKSYLTFDDIGGDVVFTNNSNNMGLILMSSLVLEVGATGKGTESYVVFNNITGKVEFSNNPRGGCIHIENWNFQGVDQLERESFVIFEGIGKGVFFTDNRAGYGTGIYTLTMDGQSGIIFNNIKGGITVERNEATSDYAAGLYMSSNGEAVLSMTNVEGDISFTDNKAKKLGGAILTNHARATNFVIDNVLGDVTFSRNQALEGAGAIYATCSEGEMNFSISNVYGNVLFKDNDGGEGNGGGLYLGSRQMVNLLLSADGGDMTFSGNINRDGELNSIWTVGPSDTQLRAKEGNSIYFYDPIINRILTSVANTHILEINKPDGGEEYTGRVVFSGKNVESGFNNDYISRILGDTVLYNGALVIEEEAHLGAFTVDPDTQAVWRSMESFEQQGGVLEIREGALVAEVFTYAAGVLRTGDGARIYSSDIDFSQGVVFDFSPFLDSYNSGLHLSGAASLTLGGNMGISDTLDYYTDNRWSQEQKYLAFSIDTDSLAGMTGDFDQIISEATGSNVIDSPYAYEGYWSAVWEDSDDDGINDLLYALWTPTAGIKEVEPEYKGALSLNSLWSSLSNVNSLKNMALGQVSLYRPAMGHNYRVWANGLGEFSHHNTKGSVDGYEYSGGGYALGTDTMVRDNWLAGIAFGNIYGTNKSKSYNSEIDQKSFMGMLYSAWTHKLDAKNALRVEGAVTYGFTDNSQKTFYSDGGTSRGSWDNDTVQLSATAHWDIELAPTLVISPFAGMEYSYGHEDAFTESGDKIRHFGSGKLQNLSLPVGVSLTKVAEYRNGVRWINSVTASYLPDVYRENPEATVVRDSNGYTWTAQGVKSARNGARLEVNSRLELTRDWALYAGYILEGRSKALYQGVNLGASYSF